MSYHVHYERIVKFSKQNYEIISQREVCAKGNRTHPVLMELQLIFNNHYGLDAEYKM